MGIRSVIIHFVLVLTTLGQIPLATGQVPTREEWGEKFNSVGVKLTHKEIRRATVQGRTVITYNLFASGLPKDKHYVLCILNVGSEPRAAADAYLNAEGKVVSSLADHDHGIAEDPIDAKVFGGKGEPVRFALISDDATMRAFADIIPFPIEETAGPCHLSLIETAPYYSGVFIHVTGLKPGEVLDIEQRSENEGGHSKAAANADGAYNVALFPSVKGKKAGKAHFALSAESCQIGIEFPWGQGSFHYQ